MKTDLVVVGGGPVGLATAIYARLAGLSAVVLEARTPPLDKACGEGIMPSGVRALDELGVELERRERATLAGVRFVDGATSAETRFADGEGWGVRRTTLVAALERRARDLGVEVRWGTRARAIVDDAGGATVDCAAGRLAAAVVVGADGLHGVVRRSMWGPTPEPSRPRFGMRRHFGVTPWSDLVEVHFGDGFEAYVTPVGRGEVGVALLGGAEVTHAGRLEALVGTLPALRERLAGARPTSEARGAGPFLARVPGRVRGRVALVGDAAGYVDALTGEGLSLGWRSARALVEVVASGQPLAAYETAYRRTSRSYVLLTRLAVAIAARPRLRARGVAALRRDPTTFARLVAALGEDGAPWGALARLIPLLAGTRRAEAGGVPMAASADSAPRRARRHGARTSP